MVIRNFKTLLILFTGLFLYPVTLMADGWEEIYFRSVHIDNKTIHFTVSSELDAPDPGEGKGRYGGFNLFDNKLSTAWVEGVSGYGIGEYIITATGTEIPQAVIIHNGYQKSGQLYKMNSRPSQVAISVFAGFSLEGDVTELASRYRLGYISGPVRMELEDKMGAQIFDISVDRDQAIALRDSLAANFTEEFEDEIKSRKELCPDCDMTPQSCFFVKIEILDIYKGSEWDDTCISGLSFKDPSDNLEERLTVNNEAILSVYQDEESSGGRILFDTENIKGLVLVDKTMLEEYRMLGDDEHLDIVLMDVSPDMEWAQVDLIFYTDGSGRAEEISTLFNVRMQERVDDAILDTGSGIFGFVKDRGKIWLDTINGLVDLDSIRAAMNDGL